MSEQTLNSERPPIASAVITHEGKVLLVGAGLRKAACPGSSPVAKSKQASRPGGQQSGNAGRMMIYVACKAITGKASVIDEDELDNLAWVSHQSLSDYVPYGFYEPVQNHLDATLIM